MTYDRKSWSPAFKDRAERRAYAERFRCVRCGKGPVHSTYAGEFTHFACLTPEERPAL